MNVTLFATCLVEHFFPGVGKATVHLLERLGHRVLHDPEETCCGQMAFNTGYRAQARAMAVSFMARFSDADAVVTPSGSCAAMVRKNYPILFRHDAQLQASAADLGKRVFELSEFLVAQGHLGALRHRLDGRVYYHSSCHLARDLGVVEQPLALLGKVDGLALCAPGADVPCCGFGGTFSIKFPEVSAAMMERKIAAIAGSGADILTACDMGCLMHLWGGLRRRGSAVRVLHLAEVLSGRTGESSLP